MVLVHFNKTEVECWFTREHYIKTEFCTKPGGNAKRIRGRPKLGRCDELRGVHHMGWVQKLELMCSQDRSGAGSLRRSSSTQECRDNGRRRRKRWRRRRRKRRRKSRRRGRRQSTRGRGRRRKEEEVVVIVGGAAAAVAVCCLLCSARRLLRLTFHQQHSKTVMLLKTDVSEFHTAVVGYSVSWPVSADFLGVSSVHNAVEHKDNINSELDATVITLLIISISSACFGQ